MPQKPKPTAREDMAHVLALGAGVSAALCTLGFALITKQEHGWLTEFAKLLLGEIGAASVTYAVLYVALFRRGISRDREILEAIKTIPASAEPSPILGLFNHPTDVDWGPLIANAQTVTLVGRYFGTWAGANLVPLRAFFRAGGTIELFVPDIASNETMKAAAQQLEGATDAHHVVAARTKILAGPRNLLETARMESKPSDVVQVRRVTAYHHLINQALLHFKSPTSSTLVTFGYDNCRNIRHKSPVLVLDMSRSLHLQDFWDAEYRGLKSDANSSPVVPDEFESQPASLP